MRQALSTVYNIFLLSHQEPCLSTKKLLKSKLFTDFVYDRTLHTPGCTLKVVKNARKSYFLPYCSGQNLGKFYQVYEVD